MPQPPPRILTPEEIRQRLQVVARDRQTRQRAYEEDMKFYDERARGFQAQCPHHWQYSSDPAGGSDSSWYCTICRLDVSSKRKDQIEKEREKRRVRSAAPAAASRTAGIRSFCDHPEEKYVPSQTHVENNYYECLSCGRRRFPDQPEDWEEPSEETPEDVAARRSTDELLQTLRRRQQSNMRPV